MGAKKLRTYTDDFKHQAVELSRQIGVSPAERKLGIPQGNIRNWQKRIEKLGKVSKTDNTPSSETLAEENKRLRQELADAKKANTILKAAAAFFSQDHLK